MKFKKNGTITGSFKCMNVQNGTFVDEDGTIVPIADLIEKVMKGETFDLTVKSSTEEDITPSED